MLRALLGKGRVKAQGTLLATTLLPSPIQGEMCAAFHYKASCLRIMSRRQRRSRLCKVTIYAANLRLQLASGEIRLEPPATEPFGPAEHQALQERGFMGFEAREQILLPGTQVTVIGTLRTAKTSDEQVLQLETMLR